MPLTPEPQGRSSNELMISVAGGDPSAFSELYDATSPRVFGLANRMLRDSGLAEDVVQDVYLNVWTHAASFDADKGAAIAWILAITHRRAVDRVRQEEAARRRHNRVAEFATEKFSPDIAVGVVSDFQQIFENRVINDCINELTSDQRTSIRLAYFGGLTYSQVAQQLDIALPTVKSRIRDGMRRLRLCIELDGLLLREE